MVCKLWLHDKMCRKIRKMLFADILNSKKNMGQARSSNFYLKIRKYEILKYIFV